MSKCWLRFAIVRFVILLTNLNNIYCPLKIHGKTKWKNKRPKEVATQNSITSQISRDVLSILI